MRAPKKKTPAAGLRLSRTDRRVHVSTATAAPVSQPVNFLRPSVEVALHKRIHALNAHRFGWEIAYISTWEQAVFWNVSAYRSWRFIAPLRPVRTMVRTLRHSASKVTARTPAELVDHFLRIGVGVIFDNVMCLCLCTPYPAMYCMWMPKQASYENRFESCSFLRTKAPEQVMWKAAVKRSTELTLTDIKNGLFWQKATDWGLSTALKTVKLTLSQKSFMTSQVLKYFNTPYLYFT